MTGSEPEARLQLLSKASDLLELLGAQGELTPSEAAEALGEPRSSLYRLLAALEDLGWVDPGARKGSFRLGTGLLHLGAMASRGLDVRTYARPEMQTLLDETGQTVFLTVRRGDDAVCIDLLPGKSVQTLALTLGGSLPLHVGAGPRALLAAESADAWQDYVRRRKPLSTLSTGEAITAKKLFSQLEEIQDSGVAVSDGDVTYGIAALGVSLRDYRGETAGALSISGLRDEVLGAGGIPNAERLLTAAARVSAALGYQPGAHVTFA